MPRFRYQAMTKTGTTVTGVLEAEGTSDLVSKLRVNGYYPIDIVEESLEQKQKIPFLGFLHKVKSSEVEFFSYQLATLLNSGVHLTRALYVASEQITNINFKNAVDQVRYNVEHGSTLHDALSQHKNIFSNLYVNIVKAGETGGVLGLVLERLAEFSEKQRKLTNAVIAAMFYPIILICLGLIIGAVLTLFVIPRLSSMFAELGAALPWPTRILMAVTGFARGYWWLILGLIIIVVVGIRQYSRTENGKYNIDKLKLRLPVIGKVFQISSLTRFTRTLGTLLENGVQILPSLEIVSETVGNEVYKEVIKTSEVDIERGESLANSLKKSGKIPGLVTHMITIGEESGRPQDMLLKLSTYYESEMDKQLERVANLIGPLMILIMALSVGFLVAAAILPIFQASNMIG